MFGRGRGDQVKSGENALTPGPACAATVLHPEVALTHLAPSVAALLIGDRGPRRAWLIPRPARLPSPSASF